jgi:hypothetical protein
MPDELSAWIPPDTNAQRGVENVGSQFLSLHQSRQIFSAMRHELASFCRIVSK